MLLTQSQKLWYLKREIKVGESYQFPKFGFTIYPQPEYSGGEYFETNPFTKSLAHERFLVKEKINGFCKGNFEYKPKSPDAYMLESELAYRDLIEIFLLATITFIPLIIYNNVKNLFNNKQK